MEIVFRVDASFDIGTGHVMRCLTLAETLRVRGANITFVSRRHPGNLLQLISQRGYTAKALAPVEDVFTPPADPSHSKWLGTDWSSDAEQTQQALKDQVIDWLVVDHYALDRRWEQVMRPFTRRLMAIDDLADRLHDCDLLLDQNLCRQAKDYDELINHYTKTLIGPAYVLLRPEFEQWRKHSLHRRANPMLKNLLITMGGVDQTNATGQVLDALTLCELPSDLRITVVMGQSAPWLDQVKTQAATMPRPTHVLEGVNNMAQLMAESDLCIGAAGGSAWERCALGLPTLVLILSANQHSGAMALQSHQAARVAHDAHQLIKKMSDLFNKNTQSAALHKMSQAGAKLAVGSGASQVVELLLEPYV